MKRYFYIASILFAIGITVYALGTSTGLQSDNSMIRMPVGSVASAAIEAGDVVTFIQAGDGTHSGYIEPAAAGEDAIIGVALSSATIPSTSGGQTVLVNFSTNAIFYYPADATADVTVNKIGTLVDLASDKTIDGDASTDDVFQVVAVDPSEDTSDTTAGFYVRINPEEQQF